MIEYGTLLDGQSCWERETKGGRIYVKRKLACLLGGGAH